MNFQTTFVPYYQKFQKDEISPLKRNRKILFLNFEHHDLRNGVDSHSKFLGSHSSIS